jgi:hypothetical protein
MVQVKLLFSKLLFTFNCTQIHDHGRLLLVLFVLLQMLFTLIIHAVKEKCNIVSPKRQTPAPLNLTAILVSCSGTFNYTSAAQILMR